MVRAQTKGIYGIREGDDSILYGPWIGPAFEELSKLHETERQDGRERSMFDCERGVSRIR